MFILNVLKLQKFKTNLKIIIIIFKLLIWLIVFRNSKFCILNSFIKLIWTHNLEIPSKIRASNNQKKFERK